MRIIFKIATVFLMVYLLAACKTTEENYRAAYEKAKEKQTENYDSLTNVALKTSQEPRMMKIEGVALPVLTIPVRVVKSPTDDFSELRKYCVAVGKFKQIFNARSMCTRLKENGFAQPQVVVDRLGDNYVICGSSNSPVEASEILESAKSTDAIVPKAPFPYILRPAQLVR